MTRQRIRVSLLDSMSEECPSCKGSGKIISIETLITRIEHWLRRYKAKHMSLRIKLKLHPKNARYLNKEKKSVLKGLMWKNFIHLKIIEDPDLRLDEFRFLRSKDDLDITKEMGIEKE